MKNIVIQNSLKYSISVVVALLTIFCFCSKVYAQVPDILWAKQAGGSDFDQGLAIDVDASGNSYVTGYFTGSATFGTIVLPGGGLGAMFIVKYDPFGNALWAKQVVSSEYVIGQGITVDASGNSCATGTFRGTATFGTIILTSGVAGSDIFIAKYDPSGNVLWAKQGGGISTDLGHEITMDASGNSYVTGEFVGTATFDTIMLTSVGANDVFIAKYDPSGNVLWAERAGGTNQEIGYGITVDASGNSYVTGDFQGTPTFGTITLTSTGGQDIFIAKYDPSGNVLWAKQAGGTGFDQGLAIDVDASGNSYATGLFSGSATFGTIVLTSLGSSAAFIAKYDPFGNALWAEQTGNVGFGITVDASGNSYVTGRIASVGGNDVFVAKHDPSGNLLWTKEAGGTGHDEGQGITIDASNNSYVTGYFEGTATFGTTSLTSAGSADIFVTKLGTSQPNPNIFWVEDFSAFNAAQYYVAGNAYYDATNQYFILTPPTNENRGRIFYKTLFPMAEFVANFDIKIGGGSGADGIVFAFIEDYTYPASFGGGLDFLGASGYGVEFDTWYNAEHGDPSEEHIAMVHNSANNHLSFYIAPDGEIEDNQWHQVFIQFSLGQIKVYFDGALKLDYFIPNFQIFNGYFGFTAATGVANNWQIIDNIMVSNQSGAVILSSPNGGEFWEVGSSYNITWGSINISQVNLEFSIDGGSTWMSIASNIPAESGSYTWIIPNTPSSNCLVRISDASNPSIFDISNNVFTITLDALSEGLVAYYPFNGNANDESGNGYNGVVNGASLTTDRFNNPNSAFHFDGINDYISASGSFPSAASPRTLCTWAKSGDMVVQGNADHVINYGSAEPGRAFGVMGYIGNTWWFYGHDPLYDINTTVPIDTNWHFHCVIYDGINVTYYIDTLKIVTASRNLSTTVSNLIFGIRPDISFDNTFNGKIDDVRIYNRELTEQDIQKLYGEISTPSITVLSPYGGETWQVGSQQNITWSNTGVTNVKIEYSTNGGATWEPPIINSYPASNQSYEWTVPDTPTNNGLVRISDASNTAIFDISNASFRIIPNVTFVISHGFTFDPGTPQWRDYKWQFCMADAVSLDRQICFIRQGKVYRTYLNYSGFSGLSDGDDIDLIVANHFTENLNLDPNKNVVFVFDWVKESDLNTHGYLEAAADVLAAALIKTAKDYPWLLEELHFIGHSRGTVLNSECIERLIFLAGSGQTPPGIEVDHEIHMTTLDPHPAGHWVDGFEAMNDDNVNLLFLNNQELRLGVIGWKMGEYKAGFIDNYYETTGTLGFPTPFGFIGLSHYPGSNDRSLDPIFDALDILTGTHSLVHTWYHGTVDLFAIKDQFTTGQEIRRTNWYSDDLGAEEGFHFSEIRDGDISLIASNTAELIDVSEDKKYGNDFLIFNGNFSISPDFILFSGQTPGWAYQGGGESGFIGNSTDDGGMNDHLVLNAFGHSRKHNWFFIPQNASHLLYRIRVKDKSFNDELKIRVGNIEDTYPLQNEHEYRGISTPVSSLQGTVQTLEFAIEGNGSITSEVWIDDVSFIFKPYLSLIVASPVKLHAYDSNGNHTGPTSDSTYVTEIPGSSYFAESDTLPHPRQIITLPEAPPGVEYYVEILSDNATGSFDFEIQDVTDSLKSVTVSYDSVLSQTNTVAAFTLQSLTPQFNLPVDLDGDGTFETMVAPSLFLESFQIIATAGPHGSITPTDTSFGTLNTFFANYGDTLTFAIMPDSGYIIQDVLIDGISIGPVPSYTFNNITADHTISAAFTPDCTPGLLGDITGDGATNSTDGLVLLSYDAGFPLPQPFLDRIAIGFGDVNEDNLTNSTDALITLSWEAGFPVPFPVGQQVCLPDNSRTTTLPTKNASLPAGLSGLNHQGLTASKMSLNKGSATIRASAAPANAQLLAGQTIEIPVLVDVGAMQEQLGSYTVTLEWNPSVLQFEGYHGGSAAGFDNPVVNTAETANGKLIAAHACPQGAGGAVNILNLQFKVAGTPGADPGLSLKFTALAAARTFTDLLPYLELSEHLLAVEELPTEYAIANYPNPFNASTEIHYQLPEAGKVEIVLYNLLGQKIRVLVNQRQEAGKYRLTWNGDSEQGQMLPSGIYFLRMRAGKFVADRKLLLLK